LPGRSRARVPPHTPAASLMPLWSIQNIKCRIYTGTGGRARCLQRPNPVRAHPAVRRSGAVPPLLTIKTNQRPQGLGRAGGSPAGHVEVLRTGGPRDRRTQHTVHRDAPLLGRPCGAAPKRLRGVSPRHAVRLRDVGPHREQCFSGCCDCSHGGSIVARRTSRVGPADDWIGGAQNDHVYLSLHIVGSHWSFVYSPTLICSFLPAMTSDSKPETAEI